MYLRRTCIGALLGVISVASLPETVAAVAVKSQQQLSTSSPQKLTPGYIDSSSENTPHLRVLVHPLHLALTVHSYNGADSSPFALTFSLPSLADGDYVLELCGSPGFDYPHIRLAISNGSLMSAYERRNPLLIAAGHKKPFVSLPSEIAFVPRSVVEFSRSHTSWWASIASAGYKIVLLQILSLAFVIWFPRYIGTLDSSTIAMLTGEEEVDVGDPNSVLKRLTR
jgi:hypothetical protein